MTHDPMTRSRIFYVCLLCVAVCLWHEVTTAAAAPSRGAQAAVPLFDNLGTLHHPVTTASDQAQRYFDQGLRLVYAFNHDEAVRAFEEAARLDPSAAMAYWGIALALGPNINATLTKEHERQALAALHKARTHSAHASAAERGYIEALSKRYGSQGQPRKALDQAYADAMRSVWHEFPNDPDAGVLFAEAMMDLRPWDLWTEKGQARPGTEEILSTLESVITRFPDHPGACHYYIHAVEASPAPERALACAERLPGLMPGAGHLVHMPAHVYTRLGRYHESAERNAQATSVDRKYLAGRNDAEGYATGYYAHNLHFLWASLAMEGRRIESLKVARELALTMTEEEARTDTLKKLYLSTPIWSMIRFGQWGDMLREPAPSKDLRLHQGLWRLGRGLALAGTGRLYGAEAELVVLTGLTKRLGRDRTSHETIERTVLKISERLLAGEVALRQGKNDNAITMFKDAVALEEELPYSEPPFWPISVRHYLGAALLAAGRQNEAEGVYRTDLAKNPNNGWALFGLIQSLHAQGKTGEAEEAERQFTIVWGYADVTLVSSRY